VARELGRAGVRADWVEAPGTHDWPLWREALAGHLRFHWENVKP
jgi:S-formylglutathione hydrolase FrmB